MIEYALYHKDWPPITDDKTFLESNVQRVIPTEYTEDMKGHIFCYACNEGLTRSPLHSNSDASGRRAYFKHTQNPTYKCELKAKRTTGKIHSPESTSNESATNGGLVIVRTFRREEQKKTSNRPSQYLTAEQGAQNDRKLTNNALHFEKPNEPFSDSSTANTVLSICRDFDKNLKRPYRLPDSDQADVLSNLLVDIRKVADVDPTPKLYFGRIIEVTGLTKPTHNKRSTLIEFPTGGDHKDFCLTTNRATTEQLGIDQNLIGRIILVYGKITKRGLGLCITNIHPDEFAVLPSKYDSLLL